MKKVVATFEQLIQSYYGGSSDIELRPLSSLDAVITNYYGKSPRKQKGTCKPSAQVTTRADDGEVLSYRKNGKCDEYVVQSSLSPAAAGNEYVVERHGCRTAVPAKVAKNSTDQDEAAAAECNVDVLQSQRQSVSSQPKPRPSAQSTASSSPLPTRQPSSEVIPPGKPEPGSGEDDFAADLKAILTGQSVYDSQKKRMVSRDQMDREKSQTSNGNGERPSAESTNQHEIFDRIAQSMQYANQFDLGEIALSKRLDDFDEVYELKQKAKAPASSRAMSSPATSEGTSKPSTGDFIHDLDSIRNQRSLKQPTMSLEVADDSRYVRPMFDTGEHVLIAPDLYVDLLHVGKDRDVTFSYGQIVAMADFYENVAQMMEADSAELRKIKALIQRSTDFYRTKDKKFYVRNKDWRDATNGRYVTLAQANYEHFSPDFLLGAFFAAPAPKNGNNKAKWESYHKEAIEAAQAVYATQPNGSPFLEYPLIVNAFGDHYLTDAFAAGHMINKDEMLAYFSSNFFDGTELKKEGGSFFGKLARVTFKERVKDAFSRLETADLVTALIGERKRINSTREFEFLLTFIAKQDHENVGNIAVKALHDKLNEKGLDVVNGAGDSGWRIKGDGHLNDKGNKSLPIIQKAVMQSVGNITDPALANATLTRDFDSYYKSVWQYVPQLTEGSKSQVIALAKEYLSPTDSLVGAACDIINRDLETMIDTLKDRGLLKDI